VTTWLSEGRHFFNAIMFSIPILVAKCKINLLNIFTHDYLRPWKFGTHARPQSLIIIGCYRPGSQNGVLFDFGVCVCVYQDVCCWVIGMWISSVYCKELLVMYSPPMLSIFLVSTCLLDHIDRNCIKMDWPNVIVNIFGYVYRVCLKCLDKLQE
jgi:hypothetical protein